MIEYKYNEKDKFVPDLGRPIRVGDVGLNKDKTYSFIVRTLVGDGSGYVSWRVARTHTHHCTACETGNGCQLLRFYINEHTLEPQGLSWLVKPKKTILIYNKGA